MKFKTTRICARKGCNKEFKLYRSTDKYCSPACAYADQKDKPHKKRKPIKQVSDKRRRESYTYTKKRKTFLSKEENKYCPVCKAVFDGIIDPSEVHNPNEIFRNKGLIKAREVHHKAGRKGKLLNYVPFWLAVSRRGHLWIHANPAKAYKLDFLIRSTTVNI
ncbi:MAG: hypothetical protein PVG07_00060 [Acidobacteriota bacterium]|jgi:hypothetical protein